jgi:energy-coupling factor transport system ATP-binding protein
MVFQNPEHVFTKGSIRDEIAMSAPDSADAAAVAGMLAVWGLTGLERRHPLDLSEGQKRRLALAVIAVAPRWPLLVLDEPTAGLDAAGAAFLERRLRQLADEGRTLALVTHDVDLARRLADVLVVVRDGRAREIGGAEALDDPETRARWGVPAPLCAPLRAWLASEGAARTAC